MLKRFVVLVSLAVLALPSLAQSNTPETPRFDLFAGYQYTHVGIGAAQDGLNSLTDPLNLPRIDLGRSLSLNGGNLSFQENKNSWFGGVVDFSGSMTNKKVDLSQVAQALGLVRPGTTVTAGFKPTLYTITGGPQFTYRKHEHFQPFARVLLGLARADLAPNSTTSAAINSATTSLGLPHFQTTRNSFAFMGGVGTDYVLKRWLALRASADYQRTYLFSSIRVPLPNLPDFHLPDEHQGSFRISAGVSFRLHPW